MFCSRCGNKIADGNRFCTVCGNPMPQQQGASYEGLQMGVPMFGGVNPNMQGGQMPGGVNPNMQGGQMPGGVNPNMQGGQMPGGMNPNMQGGQMPGGVNPNMQGGQMPWPDDEKTVMTPREGQGAFDNNGLGPVSVNTFDNNVSWPVGANTSDDNLVQEFPNESKGNDDFGPVGSVSEFNGKTSYQNEGMSGEEPVTLPLGSPDYKNSVDSTYGMPKNGTGSGGPVGGYGYIPEPVADLDREIEEKSGAAGKIAIILSLVLIILVLLGGIAYILLFKKDTSPTDESKPVATETVADAGNNQDIGGIDEPVSSEEESVSNADFEGKRRVTIEVRQVENADFPEVTLYANISDDTGNVVEDIDQSDLIIEEIVEGGELVETTLENVYRMRKEDDINVNLVLDQSGSMSGNKMDQAKNAANVLVDQMTVQNSDKVEVISFDDYVYLKQEFTNDNIALHNAINSIIPGSSTAFFDALCSGLNRTYGQVGAKCVIGFTDGEENASTSSYEDVVELSMSYGIPVYIIGIGADYDTSMLENLAADCSGRYYSADENNLESILEDIYLSIYREQQDYYIVKYRSQSTSDMTKERQITLRTAPGSKYDGEFTRNYKPVPVKVFPVDKDFMIPDSSSRAVTAADLDGMSLAELRIARNEIFARHGRQFKDPLLNQWFYSKSWYLSIDVKYAPDEFNAKNGRSLSTLENSNAEFILNYEQNKMNSEDIFPDASNVLLSEYDLSLTDAVLKRALQQMNGYPQTEILIENKKKVQEAIDAEDVSYH